MSALVRRLFEDIHGVCPCCGTAVYYNDPEGFMCPQRYISPHTDGFLDVLAEEALRDITHKQHLELIKRATERYGQRG